MQPAFATHDVEFNSICYPDISIMPGEAAFFSGPSGSGKTTLLRIFNGTRSPTKGNVYIDGEPIEKLNMIQLRRHALMAGQDVFLFRGTVQYNFNVFHAYQESDVPSEETIRACLDVCGSAADLESVCDSMSGGEKQRVFIAVALSMKPQALLLDEPTSALDGQLAMDMMKRIRSRCSSLGITLLVVSHDSRLVDMYADQVIGLGSDAL